MSRNPKRILCIEDNPMNWRLVQRLLSKAGYDMHWAEDGLLGCRMALELQPDLILLDINLPGLSGFEVATKLRQLPETAKTLIVALTAKTMRSDRETALVTGCDGFISKPIDPFLFVDQVEAYLGGQRDHLEQGREEAALRQFSHQVVEHLEAQLREAQESNRKLLEAQAELEQRSSHLARLLALGQDLIPLRSEAQILARAIGQLRVELGLQDLRSYRLHESGAYLQGYSAREEGAAEIGVLSGDHPVVAWTGRLPSGTVLVNLDLRQSAAWPHGLDLGWWDPRAQAFLVPFHSRSDAGMLKGFLVGWRMERPFLPFETELAALYAGILQVSLENASLIAHLDETSQALGTSYEGLESAYEALKEAQRALGAQNQKTALGGLFLNMAQQLQEPVQVLKEESANLSAFMDQPELPAREERVECHRAMDQIRSAISRVDGLVRALLHRAGRTEAAPPEWIHLHDLLRQELDLMQAEGSLPPGLSLTLNLQAPRDLIFGVPTDFSEILGHLVAHARGGRPGAVILRTWGGQSHFRLELEDNGTALSAAALEEAFQPFPDLRPAPSGEVREPGRGLPACAQILGAYGGTIQVLPWDSGSLVRISLPME